MKAEIIAIGTELLMGYIVNTNAKDIAQELLDIGIGTYYQQVVGDNKERIKEALEIASNRSDIIIISGGLGPTEDDVTKTVLVEFLGKKVVLDNEQVEKIEAHFKEGNRVMTPNNIRQAYTIEGAQTLPNDVGLATGLIYPSRRNANQYYVVLPGPPFEMNHMLVHYVKPFLIDRVFNREIIDSSYINLFGIGESAVADKVEDLIAEQTNPTIAIYAQPKRVTIRLTASGDSKEKTDELLDSYANKILERVGDYFIGFGEAQTYEKYIIDQLKEMNLTLSVAESLTGGLVLEKLTNTPGASQVIKGGVVTYQTESKNTILNIPMDIIDEFTVVSAEVAKEMAERTLMLTHSDLALSLTGVAGPDSLANHPVGEVYIALATKGSDTTVLHLNINDKPRDVVRGIAKHEALKLVDNQLKK